MGAAAGHIGVAHSPYVPGAEAKIATGAPPVNVEPKVVPTSAPFTAGSSITVDAAVLRAAEEVLSSDAGTLAASAEQRPAAYRFELRDGKIDVLPEPPEPEDREFALDIYQELVAKARELHERLKGTNSARRVCDSVERLLTALGTQFDDIRPGVLLSRSRSIEADRTAFGDELLPDTIAMMDDTARTLRDLLAAFPIVRRVEAEVLALDLDRSADAIPALREEMAAIKAAAEKSGAVTVLDGSLPRVRAGEDGDLSPAVVIELLHLPVARGLGNVSEQDRFSRSNENLSPSRRQAPGLP
jgi:hypothetical protein